MNDTTAKRIEKLRKAMHGASNASRNEDQKRAAAKFMVQRAIELKAERDILEARMNAGWDYLDRLDEEHPDYRRNEDRLITWIRDYEAISDVLDDAERRHAGLAA